MLIIQQCGEVTEEQGDIGREFLGARHAESIAQVNMGAPTYEATRGGRPGADRAGAGEAKTAREPSKTRRKNRDKDEATEARGRKIGSSAPTVAKALQGKAVVEKLKRQGKEDEAKKVGSLLNRRGSVNNPGALIGALEKERLGAVSRKRDGADRRMRAEIYRESNGSAGLREARSLAASPPPDAVTEA